MYKTQGNFLIPLGNILKEWGGGECIQFLSFAFESEISIVNNE